MGLYSIAKPAKKSTSTFRTSKKEHTWTRVRGASPAFVFVVNNRDCFGDKQVLDFPEPLDQQDVLQANQPHSQAPVPPEDSPIVLV